MPAIYEHRHIVAAEEIDQLGHANNVAYVEWMQAAALAHSAAQGWPADRYRRQGQGWVVRAHAVEYLQPAFAGDRIVVRTWVATMRKATSLRRYRIFREPDESPSGHGGDPLGICRLRLRPAGADPQRDRPVVSSRGESADGAVTAAPTRLP